MYTKLTTLAILGILSTTMVVGSVGLTVQAAEKTNSEQAIESIHLAGGAMLEVDRFEGTPLFGERLLVIVNFLLTLIGIVAFFLLLYAGYEWMLARGNEERVERSKKIIREVIIGLIVIVIARILTEVILTQIGSATSSVGG